MKWNELYVKRYRAWSSYTPMDGNAMRKLMIFLLFFLLFAINHEAQAQCGSTSTAINAPDNYNPNSSASLPAIGSSYAGEYGCNAKRISGTGPDWSKHQYSKMAAVSDNDTWMLIYEAGWKIRLISNSSLVCSTGLNFSTEPLWAMPGAAPGDDEGTLYYHTGQTIRKYDVETCTSSLLEDISATLPGGSMTFCGGESDLSDDGNHLCVSSGTDPLGEIRLYTISTTTLGPAANCNSDTKCSQGDTDSGYITPITNDILVDNNNAGYNYQELFDGDTGLFIKRIWWGGHGDLGVDASGDEVIVMHNANEDAAGSCTVSCTEFTSSPGGCGYLSVIKIRISDRQITCLMPEVDSDLLDFHISINNEGRHHFKAIITFMELGGLSDQPSTGSWFKYADEILSINMDGTGVRRLIHHLSRRLSSQYFPSPRSTMSRSGRYVVYDSNFGMGTGEEDNLSVYLMDIGVPGIYVSQNGAGAETGVDCSTARDLAWLNTAGNWGGGGGEVDPGDVVHLCGTFTVSANQNVITIQGSGSAGNPITILFESGASLQAPYFSGYPSGGAIICSSKSYIIIDGGSNGFIEATANGSARANQQNSVGIRWNTCSNGEVKNLSIPNQYVRTPSSSENIGVGMGIFATNGQNVDIHHNTIDDSQYNIYYTYTGTSSQNITIRDNILSRTAACIVVGDESGGSLIDNIYVLRNDCSDTFVWDSPEDYFHCDGFHMWASNTNSRYTDMVIDKNYIHGDFGGHTTSPIYASCDNGGGVGACTARITNNLVHSAVSNGTNGHIYVAYNMDAALIANNTLIGGTNQGSGISIEVNTNNVVVKNNIVSGFNSWIAVDGSSDVSESNYNEVNCTGNLNQCVYYDAGFYTWANWKSTFSEDANSLGPSSAPGLDGTFHLQAGSPGVGAGVNLNSLGFTELGTDIDAQTRPVSGVWDIGADQRGGGGSPSWTGSGGIILGMAR